MLNVYRHQWGEHEGEEKIKVQHEEIKRQKKHNIGNQAREKIPGVL